MKNRQFYWGAATKAVAAGLLVTALVVACAEFSFPPKEGRIDEYGQLVLPMGPYQVAGDPGEVLVGVQLPELSPGETEEGELLYWKLGSENDIQSTPFLPAWDRLQYVRLSDLEPGQEYRMSVVTPAHTTAAVPIKVPSDTLSKFKFLVVGDTKPYPLEAATQLVNLMAQREASLYVHLGDFARSGDYVDDWANFLYFHRPLLSKMPIIPAIGNHDRSRHLVFTRLFLLPQKSGQPTRYYRVPYGNTLFIVLDPYEDYTPGSAQYEFLEDSLVLGTAPGLEHVFLVSHKPFYSSGSHGSDQDLRANLLHLVEKYPVTAVLAAHDHSYQRTKAIKGTVHIVSGGGGAKLTGVSIEDFTARVASVNHFIEISVDGPKVFLTAIDNNGTVIDEAQIK